MDSWEGGPLRLEWRPFRFTFHAPLRNARGELKGKEGWLLRLETEQGAVGWGEAAPLAAGPLAGAGTDFQTPLRQALAEVGNSRERSDLERLLPGLPPTMAFAIGAALAELDGWAGSLGGGWLPPPPAARLLPAGEAMLDRLEEVVAEERSAKPSSAGSGATPRSLTVKWKVAALDDTTERNLLELLLERLPPGSSLRLDANGGWDRCTATAWAERLAPDPSLEWLEQPLPASDLEGLELLARNVPVALDESLQWNGSLRATWDGWQIRRPSQDGDLRPLLRQLQTGAPRLALSTAFETGIGRRWLHHLAALQAAGPFPTAPGLAPGWCPDGPLFSEDPALVWAAATL